jgi:hypothetical protein
MGRTLEVIDLPAVVREMPVAFPYDFYGPGLLEHNLGWIDQSADLPAVVREMPVAFPYDFYGPGLLEHNLR